VEQRGRLSRRAREISTVPAAQRPHQVRAATPLLRWSSRPEDDGMQRKPEHRVEVRLGVVHCIKYVFAEERFLHGGLL